MWIYGDASRVGPWFECGVTWGAAGYLSDPPPPNKAASGESVPGVLIVRHWASEDGGRCGPANSLAFISFTDGPRQRRITVEPWCYSEWPQLPGHTAPSYIIVRKPWVTLNALSGPQSWADTVHSQLGFIRQKQHFLSIVYASTHNPTKSCTLAKVLKTINEYMVCRHRAAWHSSVKPDLWLCAGSTPWGWRRKDVVVLKMHFHQNVCQNLPSRLQFRKMAAPPPPEMHSLS